MDLVESKYEERNDKQNLYHKLLWQPMYKVFIGYGINFPISQELLGELKAFLTSVKKTGKYPEGNFFDPTRVCELNKIQIAKFPPKRKSSVVSTTVSGRGGRGGGGGRGGRGGRGGGRGGGERDRKRASVGSTSQSKRKRSTNIKCIDL